MTTATAGTTPCKNDFILNLRTSQLCKSAQYAYWSKNLLRLNMHPQRSLPKEDTKNQPLRFTFSKIHRTWSFHVVVLQRTAEKCTKFQNARAQLLFYSSNLLFSDVPIAVAVVVCKNSPFLVNAHAELQHLFMLFRSLSFKLKSNCMLNMKEKGFYLTTNCFPLLLKKPFATETSPRTLHLRTVLQIRNVRGHQFPI